MIANKTDNYLDLINEAPVGNIEEYTDHLAINKA